MFTWVIGYGATALAFLMLDGLWLSLATPSLYRPAMGPLLAERVVRGAAISFYLIYIGGIVLFAVAPAIRASSPLQAVLLGGALGLVAYATYDLTNLATLRGWPLKLSFIDLGWGTLVTAVAALAGYWAIGAVTRAG